MATLTQPTIEDLIGEARNLLGQPSSTNSTWSDEEIASYANEAVRRYYAEVVLHSEGQFTAESDLDLVANQDYVTLPTDFYEIKGVWKKVSGGYAPLHYRNNLTEGYSTDETQSGESYRPYYYFRGNKLILRPGPSAAETAGIRIEYIQFPESMLSGGDSLTNQVSAVFRDLIVMYIVYKAKLKESLSNGMNTYGPARENLNDLYSAFQQAIPGRSHNPTAIKPFNPESE